MTGPPAGSSAGAWGGEAPDARPRLLFLSPVVPAPLDRGQNVRLHHLVEGLARHFRVTLVVPEGPGLEEASSLWSVVEQVVAVEAALESIAPRELAGFLVTNRTLMRPVTAARLLAYQRALAPIGVDRFAAVWVARTSLAWLVRSRGPRVVVDMDDVEHRVSLRELRSRLRRRSGGGLLKPLVHAGQLLVREVVLARRYGACAVASPDDAAYLRRRGLRTVAVLRNGVLVDSEDVSPPSRDAGAPGRVVLLGNLGYGPNLDALTHFEDDIRPALDRLGVTVEVTVIGPGATEELAARFPRVVFRGFVPEVAAELRTHDVLVAPLRLGGGTKLKVLDAMAAGLPVVTTSVGAEGLSVTDGVHVLVADGPEAFAAAAARVLGDGVLARRLGEDGRRLVAERFSWRPVQDEAVALVNRVLA